MGTPLRPEGGASGAIAVAVGYALGSQAGQALNVAVAEAQAFVQSLGLQLGNLFPAVTDQFVNPGQVFGHGIQQWWQYGGVGRTAGRSIPRPIGCSATRY